MTQTIYMFYRNTANTTIMENTQEKATQFLFLAQTDALTAQRLQVQIRPVNKAALEETNY